MKLDDIKQMPCWVPWFWFQRDGDDKPSKCPTVTAKYPSKWKYGSTNILITYDNAIALMKSDPAFAGIGLVIPKLPDDKDLIIIDLDDCIDPVGTIMPDAKAVLDQLPGAYVERSPSMTGLHCWCVADLGGKRKGNFDFAEVLVPGLFSTFTGNVFSGTLKSPESSELPDLTALVSSWYAAVRHPVSLNTLARTYSPGYGCKWPEERCPYLKAAIESECAQIRSKKHPNRTPQVYHQHSSCLGTLGMATPQRNSWFVNYRLLACLRAYHGKSVKEQLRTALRTV